MKADTSHDMGGDKGQSHSVFHTGHDELLLFPSVVVSTQQHLVGACFVVFLVALLYEGLRLFVSWLQVYINTQCQWSRGRIVFLGAIHTTSYLVHLFIGYCLMVIFMLLNAWICLALMLGAGTGFVLFHFRPVKLRLFRFLFRGDNKCLEAEDNDRLERTAENYEQMEAYKLTDVNGKK